MNNTAGLKITFQLLVVQDGYFLDHRHSMHNLFWQGHIVFYEGLQIAVCPPNMQQLWYFWLVTGIMNFSRQPWKCLTVCYLPGKCQKIQTFNRREMSCLKNYYKNKWLLNLCYNSLDWVCATSKEEMPWKKQNLCSVMCYVFLYSCKLVKYV